LGAHHQTGAQRRSGQRGGVFAMWVGQALVGHGRYQNGVRQRSAQQRHPGVTARQRPQHAGQQLERLPGQRIGPQRDLVGRAAIEVGPHRLGQQRLGVLFVVKQAHEP
jgi:hypothetical protein